MLSKANGQMKHERINRETSESNLLEKLKGEKIPDGSLAAHPKAFLGCSNSASTAISIRYSSLAKECQKDREGYAITKSRGQRAIC